jgi:hypothetical protein
MPGIAASGRGFIDHGVGVVGELSAMAMAYLLTPDRD